MRITLRNGFEAQSQDEIPCIQVVIDVFRAASTALALLKVGVKQLVIANDLKVIQDFQEKGFKIISEVFDLGIDNSPTLVLGGNFRGEATLLKTSNLTTAIAENFNSSKMLIGAFNNLPALSQYIKKQDPKWVELVPAGLMLQGQICPEDTECALKLKGNLEGVDYEPNWISIDEKVKKQIAKEERPQFYIDDLRHSLILNFTNIIPMVKKIDDKSFEVEAV